MTTPAVASLVSALLASGAAPGEVEREVVRELRRQSAPCWRREETGAWYEVMVCFECGRSRVGCRMAGCATGRLEPRKRYEVTLASWLRGRADAQMALAL